MALYCLDENNNKIEVTDEVLSAVVQQVVCCATGTPLKIALVTQAKYNELKADGVLEDNCLYFITDDTTADDMDEQLKALTTTIGTLQTSVNTMFGTLKNVVDTYLKPAYYAEPNYKLFSYVYGGTNVYNTYTINNVADAKYYKLVFLFAYEGSSNLIKIEYDLFSALTNTNITNTYDAASKVVFNAKYSQENKTIEIEINTTTSTSNIYLKELFLIKVA